MVLSRDPESFRWRRHPCIRPTGARGPSKARGPTPIRLAIDPCCGVYTQAGASMMAGCVSGHPSGQPCPWRECKVGLLQHEGEAPVCSPATQGHTEAYRHRRPLLACCSLMTSGVKVLFFESLRCHFVDASNACSYQTSHFLDVFFCSVFFGLFLFYLSMYIKLSVAFWLTPNQDSSVQNRVFVVKRIMFKKCLTKPWLTLYQTCVAKFIYFFIIYSITNYVYYFGRTIGII